jgi:hypothetical protein
LKKGAPTKSARPFFVAELRELEKELCTQLNLARVGEGTDSRNAPKIAAGDATDRVGKVSVIEHVIRFKAQLERLAFGNPRVLLE